MSRNIINNKVSVPLLNIRYIVGMGQSSSKYFYIILSTLLTLLLLKYIYTPLSGEVNFEVNQKY